MGKTYSSFAFPPSSVGATEMAVGEDAIVVDRSLFSFDTVLTGSFLVLVSAFLILFNTEEIFIMGLCCIAVLFLLKFTKATAGVCGKFVRTGPPRAPSTTRSR